MATLGDGPATLLERIRKRAPLGERTNREADEAPPALRRRRADEEGEGDSDVKIQRFTLVSRVAPPAKRAPPQHAELIAPPGLVAELGDRIQVCRCSDCPGGLRGRTRLCRRNTESHSEYALLLNMNSRFEAECPARPEASALVGEACCREKSAYFILGPDKTTVGYVAATTEANRRVPGRRDSGVTREMQVPSSVPALLQIYVEPEFRRRGLATTALSLLLRGHDALLADDPSEPIVRILGQLGFARAGSRDGPDGRPVGLFLRNAVVVDV